MRCSAGSRWHGGAEGVLSVLRSLLIVCLVSITMGAARGQNDVTADKPPFLSILGVYSFSWNKVAYARFIRELVDSHDPTNFSEEVKAILQRRGDKTMLLTGEARQELEGDLRFYMDNAALLEVLV